MAPILSRVPTLSASRHDRDVVGLRYVYPVVSRRTAGVSVGVNLNPNHACNWRCIYCQIPDLVRGRGPKVDLAQLRTELVALLDDILHGDFLERWVPEAARRLQDVALSGDGEPTSSPDFVAAVDVIADVLRELDLIGRIRIVLITNGSLLDRPPVRDGVRRLAAIGGEVWFKLDATTANGMRAVNGTAISPAVHLRRLRSVAALCPTWIQTCMFERNGEPPAPDELDAYLDAIRELVTDRTPVRGVLLYSLARPSLRPEASELGPLDADWLEAFAARIRAAGLPASSV